MEEIRCHICSKTKESLDKNETLISVEYNDGRKACHCSICNGLIEKIAESAFNHIYVVLTLILTRSLLISSNQSLNHILTQKLKSGLNI